MHVVELATRYGGPTRGGYGEGRGLNQDGTGSDGPNQDLDGQIGRVRGHQDENENEDLELHCQQLEANCITLATWEQSLMSKEV